MRIMIVDNVGPVTERKWFPTLEAAVNPLSIYLEVLLAAEDNPT